MQYEMLNTDFKLSLVQGLMAIGQFDIALARIDETISLVEENGDLLHMPEALRVKGNALLSLPQRRADENRLGAIPFSLSRPQRRQVRRSAQLP